MLQTLEIMFQTLESLTHIFYVLQVFGKHSLKYLYFYDKLKWLKDITRELEEFNIVYIKILQTICINGNLFNPEQMNYLIKYTDNVPYVPDEKDLSFLKDLDLDSDLDSGAGVGVLTVSTAQQETKTPALILTNTEPINSGVIALVYEAWLDDKKVVVKVMKNNIKEKLKSSMVDAELMCYILSFIPYVKRFNLDRIQSDCKDIILEQIDFKKEVKNIKLFKETYKKNKNLVIPAVYEEFTERNSNIIVMEYIEGLKLSQIRDEDKIDFSKLLFNINTTSILFNRVIHGDPHIGNIIFIEGEDGVAAKKIAFIDFGIIIRIDKQEQNDLYYFFREFFIKKNFRTAVSIAAGNLSYPKDAWDKLSNKNKELILDKGEKILENTYGKNMDPEFLYNINNVINPYKIYFVKNFNQVLINLAIIFGVGEKMLESDLTETVYDSLRDFYKMQEFLMD